MRVFSIAIMRWFCRHRTSDSVHRIMCVPGLSLLDLGLKAATELNCQWLINSHSEREREAAHCTVRTCTVSVVSELFIVASCRSSSACSLFPSLSSLFPSLSSASNAATLDSFASCTSHSSVPCSQQSQQTVHNLPSCSSAAVLLQYCRRLPQYSTAHTS